MKDTFRVSSLIAYSLIILAGEMIGAPFFLWLLFTVFDFGNIDQIFAILGVIGVILNFTKWRNEVAITIISFLLMLSPLVSRLLQVPLQKFNYWMFQVPVGIFIITYIIFIAANTIQKIRIARPLH